MTTTPPKPENQYVAVVSVSYIPEGKKLAKDEQRVEPGKPVDGCPPEALKEYIKRGDVVEKKHYANPEATARAAAPQNTQYVRDDEQSGRLISIGGEPVTDNEDEPA